jgi:membrane protease YdiL (CAAX protease family)
MNGDERTFLPATPPPPSSEFQATAPSPGGSEGTPPDFGLARRSLVQKPRWPHPNFIWSFLWCLLFIIVTQTPGAVVAVLIVGGFAVISPDSMPLDSLSTPAGLLKSEPMNVALGVAFFITEAIVIGFSLLIIRLVVGSDWKRQLGLRIPGFRHTLLALASFPALVLLGNIAYEVLRKTLHMPSLADIGLSGMEEMVQVFSKWQWTFAVLVIGLGPGIGEELWCRGFLGRGLVGNYGVVVGVLTTSFFFGLIHIDPCQGAMAMLMGIWLHYVYLTTKSLLLPMLLHTLNNSLAVLDTRIPQLAVIETSPSDIPIAVYLAAALLLASTAYALYQSRARLVPGSTDQLLVWRPAFEGVEHPPSDSGVKLVRPAPSLAIAATVGCAFALFAVACGVWLMGR